MQTRPFTPRRRVAVLHNAVLAAVGLMFSFSCSASAQTVLTFHYLSEYNGQPLPCPNMWGIGGDRGDLTATVVVGKAPGRWVFFAYDIIEDGIFRGNKVEWSVDPAGATYPLNPVQYFYANPEGYIPTIEVRNPQSSESNEIPFMSTSQPYYMIRQACDDAWPTTHIIPMQVYCLGAIPPTDYLKRCDVKRGGDHCEGCGSQAMARYSAHAMLASLNIEDTPVRYQPPQGPAVDFTVTYNQRDDQQPQTFAYSNLGPKWTFNWLSYVTDNPNDPSGIASVYAAGGGIERYSGFDSGSQSYLPDPQTHAVLVRTAPAAYEKRLPDGSKQVFALSDGATSYPRKIFMTQVIDPVGNAVTIGYDTSSRIATLTDALGQPTTITHLSDDPGVLPDYYLIWKVTDPFGRLATFNYTAGQLTMITDPVGIQSQFHYMTGTDFIDSLTTPYGTTAFATGESGSNKWIEMIDPIGGKERVEFRDNAPGISDTETVAPTGMRNSGLAVGNILLGQKGY